MMSSLNTTMMLSIMYPLAISLPRSFLFLNKMRKPFLFLLHPTLILKTIHSVAYVVLTIGLSMSMLKKERMLGLSQDRRETRRRTPRRRWRTQRTGVRQTHNSSHISDCQMLYDNDGLEYIIT